MITSVYKLGDLLDNYDYLREPISAIERAEFQGDYPYYGAQGIIDFVKEFKCDGEYLLIAEDGENLVTRDQPISLVAKGKFWVNNHAHIVKTKLPLNIYYLNYALNHMDINGYVTGSAQPKLSQRNLNKIKITIPILVKQELIVDILKKYDDLIENNNQRIKILEDMAESLYKEWFVRFRFPGYKTVKFENGIPKGWKLFSLQKVANVLYGYPFNSSLFKEEIGRFPVVRIRDILDKKTDTYTHEECDQKYKLNKNDILIGMDGIFHMCIWGERVGYLNQRVVRIRSLSNNISQYYLYFALYPKIKELEKSIVGTTVAHLGDRHLKKMQILVADGATLNKYNKVVNKILDELNDLQLITDNLIKQRDALLPRLMSGKLEVSGGAN